ncbi:MAG: rbfA [Verrucomicrobiales bacterium]|nr:rbfA [Verrucomicrobiales bacterium]
MQSLRLQRVQELLKREIGEVIRRELPVSEVGVITVNEVVVSSNLHSATVFVGFVGTEVQRKRGMTMLHKERKRLTGLVGRAVILKYTPQLRFVMDENAKRGDRVLQIIEQLDISSPADEIAPEDS